MLKTSTKLARQLIIAVSGFMACTSSSWAQAPSWKELPEGSVKQGAAYCGPGGLNGDTPICFDKTPCKTIDGQEYCLNGTTKSGAITLEETCWERQRINTCYTSVNQCEAFKNDPTCSMVGSAPTRDDQGDPVGSFVAGLGNTSTTYTYSCVYQGRDGSGSYNTPGDCDISGLQNGLTWNNPSKSAAGDFLLAVAAQETARQAATYGDKDGDIVMNLFPGSDQRCATGWGGLKNCCKSSGGGFTSNATAAQKIGLQVGMEAFKYGAQYAISAGSALVSDTILANAPQFLQPGLGSMFESAAGLGSAGVGAFGFGTSASAASGMFASSASSTLIGNTGIYFNPYAFAAAIAIQVVMDVISCSPEEKGLAQARQQNLCTSVGSYCSKRINLLFTKICVETKQSYCCFNGLLGKAINEVARKQYGIGWGSPQAPNCSGLTPDQVSGLNFESPEMQSALQPFMSQIMKNYENGAGKWAADGSLTGAVQTNATTGNAAKEKALCQQRKKIYPDTVCN